MKRKDSHVEIDPVPANVLVAAFTEDRLVFHSQPNLEANPIVVEGSEVVVLIHRHASQELANIQGHLDHNSSCTKDEFFDLVRANINQDWGMIETKIERAPGLLKEMTGRGRDLFCGASFSLRTRPGLFLALFSIIILIPIIIWILLPVFTGDTSPFLYRACGHFNSNGTLFNTEYLVHSTSEGERRMSECAQRLNLTFECWPCHCPTINTTVNCD